MTIDTPTLKRFAQAARRQLRAAVSARLEQVLSADSALLREQAAAITELKERIAAASRSKVIDQAAYTWFNRFCALRFMDANHYTRLGVVSPQPGFTQPEMLQEAKSGHIPEDLPLTSVNRQRVLDLLSGRLASPDPQQEAYRLLVVAACNLYHTPMPFLFEKIEDYTELLMPADLLSENSVLSGLLEAMPEEACQDVEIIGWLYQYYISERKDEVFEALKKNQKITAADIPAATQLFTPHWIVRYLVENSLGRLWLLNRPNSRLAEEMDYYIHPEQPETDFLKVNSPEEIKLCDDACGSGHMLTYAFDLLYAIYEEEGYLAVDIPRLILEKNLYGIEIDPRAAALAAFALVMKARSRDRRFFSRGVQPQICVLENVSFTDAELKDYMARVGRDLFSEPLRQTLKQFEQADNFGSLIRPELADASFIRNIIHEKNLSGDLFLSGVHQRVEKVLQMVEFLAPRYHVVVANPPYMGGKGINDDLKHLAQEQFPDSKSDLFAMFIERGFGLIRGLGYNAMVTMQSWMFLSSYEKLRDKLLKDRTLICLAHMDNMVMGIAFGTAATVWKTSFTPEYQGNYSYISMGDIGPDNKPFEFPVKNNRLKVVSASDLEKIPGKPIAYWVSHRVRDVFSSGRFVKQVGDTRQGMATSDNNRFVRNWFEVANNKVFYHAHSHADAIQSGRKWFPYNKGGEFRKWYGNLDFLVNWENGGKEVLDYASSLYGSATRTVKSISEYFKQSISWSKVSSGDLAMRYYPYGFIFDVAGCCIFSEKEEDLYFLISYINTNLVRYFLKAISPTLT